MFIKYIDQRLKLDKMNKIINFKKMRDEISQLKIKD